MTIITFLRKRARLFVDSFYCVNTVGKIEMGKDCTWFIDAQKLNADSIIYSGGVGHDISFELELVNKIGCNIFLFDPSETGLKTMEKSANQHLLVHFFPVGLSGKDGIVKFSPPSSKEEGSFKVGSDNQDNEWVSLPCRSIESIMKEHDHNRIDLLKIDIEGFEYEVLKEALRSKLDIRQICVEFHHFFETIPKRHTDEMIGLLQKEGYKIIHKRMLDYTFLKG